MKPKRLPRVGDVWERTEREWDSNAQRWRPCKVRVVMIGPPGPILSYGPVTRIVIVNPGAAGQRPMRSRPRLDTFLRTYRFVSGARP